MIREDLLEIISNYRNICLPKLSQHKSFCQHEEFEILARMKFFISNHEDCFSRNNLQGHITASAVVVDKNWDKVVLTHHRKLDKWLQLGGHADGNPNPAEVARTETEEEAGLVDIKIHSLIANSFSPIPFDFDVHYIPQHKETPEHFHYDVRYIIVSYDNLLTISDESNDLRWFSLDQARQKNRERSMIRQFDKLELIRGLDIK